MVMTPIDITLYHLLTDSTPIKCIFFYNMVSYGLLMRIDPKLTVYHAGTVPLDADSSSLSAYLWCLNINTEKTMCVTISCLGFTVRMLLYLWKSAIKEFVSSLSKRSEM